MSKDQMAAKLNAKTVNSEEAMAGAELLKVPISKIRFSESIPSKPLEDIGFTPIKTSNGLQLKPSDQSLLVTACPASLSIVVNDDDGTYFNIDSVAEIISRSRYA